MNTQQISVFGYSECLISCVSQHKHLKTCFGYASYTVNELEAFGVNYWNPGEGSWGAIASSYLAYRDASSCSDLLVWAVCWPNS